MGTFKASLTRKVRHVTQREQRIPLDRNHGFRDSSARVVRLSAGLIRNRYSLQPLSRTPHRVSCKDRIQVPKVD